MFIRYNNHPYKCVDHYIENRVSFIIGCRFALDDAPIIRA